MFEAFVSWWLDTNTQPTVLIAVRMATGALGILAAWWAWINALYPNECERTWKENDRRRWRRIAWFKALAITSAAAYFFLAAMIEGDRVGSPNRLLAGNTTFAAVFLASWLDAMFWRSHYSRKQVVLEVEGQLHREMEC